MIEKNLTCVRYAIVFCILCAGYETMHRRLYTYRTRVQPGQTWLVFRTRPATCLAPACLSLSGHRNMW